MIINTKPMILLMAGLAIAGCSSRPRQFAATIALPPVDDVAYQRDFGTCNILARKGYKSDFKAATLSTAGGTAAGIAAGAAASAVVSAGSFGSLSSGIGATVGAGVGGALIIGLPIGFGISRAIRGGREKRFKTAMTTCLGEYGYQVADWSVVKKMKKPKPM